MDANCDIFFFLAVWAKGSWLCFNTLAKQKENIKAHVRLLSGLLDCLLFLFSIFVPEKSCNFFPYVQCS